MPLTVSTAYRAPGSPLLAHKGFTLRNSAYSAVKGLYRFNMIALLIAIYSLFG